MSITIGDRMKEYERTANLHLTRRMPYIIRLDGVAFHTFTKKLRKPFDPVFIATMQFTMRDLCKDIQGVVFGYTQSDEITLVLQDYKDRNTAAWFDKSVQKIVSVAAAKATMYFNQEFAKIVTETPCLNSGSSADIFQSKLYKATFDARVFCLPESEVVNYLIWRQQDAIRNSIQAVAQANFSHRDIQGLNTSKLKEKLLAECNIDWDQLPIHQQRGASCYKQYSEDSRPKWIIDKIIPIFTENKEFVERWLTF